MSLAWQEPPRAPLGSRPSEIELVTLAAYARLGDQAAVATEMGCSAHAVRHHMSSLYARLGSHGAIETFTRLGWLRVPPMPLVAVDVESAVFEVRLRSLLDRVVELHA